MIYKFFNDEEGQALVEYGLLMALIALAVILGVTAFGRRTADMWGGNASKYPTGSS